MFLFAGCAALAQQPAPPSPPTEKPPTIPITLLKDFYAADSQQQRAQRQVDQAQQALMSASQSWKQAVDAMQKVCGEKFGLAQDSVTSDPVCKVKPSVPAVKPAEKK
jgi:hypothetical protein